MTERDVASRIVVRAYGLTDTGQRRRNNEDTFIIADLARMTDPPLRDRVVSLDASEHAVLLAVSDGMGGADAGEVASALVVDSLRRAMRDATGSWDQATKAAVEAANREVWNAAREPGRKGMGATLTAVCVHQGQAHVAVVGDSRGYLIRNSVIRQMTKDQSFVQMLVDAGAIKAEDADAYPMKNVVLQAMGQKPDVGVALGRLALRRGDRLLLCSDGLSNKVSAQDMLELVERAPSLQAACWELVELANGRGGDDNITVVLAAIEGEGVETAGFEEGLTKTFQVLVDYKAVAADLGLGDPDEVDEPPDDTGLVRIVPVDRGEPASGDTVARPPLETLPAAGLAERDPVEVGAQARTASSSVLRWAPLVALVMLATIAGMIVMLR